MENKMSAAQNRAVELLAGEEGWVRRGTIQQKTMDVLLRLNLAEARRDDSIHVTLYRATQNARDYVRGQQEDVMPEISSDAARITVDAPVVPVVTVWCEFCPPATIAPATMEAQMPNGAYVALCADTVCRERAEANNAATPAAKVVSPYAASVTRYLVKHMAYGPTDAAAVVARFADMVNRGDRFGSNVDYIAWEISSADYKADMAPAADAAQDAIDVAQAATGIHEACGLPMADHCDFCDVCPIPSEKCGCGECGNCGGNVTDCGDCGNTDTIGDMEALFSILADLTPEEDAYITGVPVIVEARQGAGYVIDYATAGIGRTVAWVAAGNGKHKIIGARRRRNSRKGK